jgi:hypothetical protein
MFKIGDRIVYADPQKDYNGKGVITHVTHPSYRIEKIAYDKFIHKWFGYDEIELDKQYYRELRLNKILGNEV